MNSPQPGTRSKATPPSSFVTFLKGLMSGLILGVALCAGVALYVTRLPTPFIAHVSPSSTAPEHAAAEGRDSNAEHGLMGPSTEGSAPVPAAPSARGNPPSPAPLATLPVPDSDHSSAAVSTALPPSKTVDTEAASKPALEHSPTPAGTGKNKSAPSAAPSAEETASNASTPWFVQTGAFGNTADAENQRAHLALLGLEATVLSPEAGDKPLYRVRLGPLSTIDEVRTLVATLKNNGIPTSISRGNSLKTR